MQAAQEQGSLLIIASTHGVHATGIRAQRPLLPAQPRATLRYLTCYLVNYCIATHLELHPGARRGALWHSHLSTAADKVRWSKSSVLGLESKGSARKGLDAGFYL